MRTPAFTIRLPGRERADAGSRRGARRAAWIAATVLHAAALAVFVTTIRPGARRHLRIPVALTPPAVPAVPVPADPVATGAPVVRPLPAPPLRAPVPRGAPVPDPVAVRPAPDIHPAAGGTELVRSYRKGAAPADTAAVTEEALRQVALAEATERWNAELHGLIPEIRLAMFLEALEKSPFPRR